MQPFGIRNRKALPQKAEGFTTEGKGFTTEGKRVHHRRQKGSPQNARGVK